MDKHFFVTRRLFPSRNLLIAAALASCLACGRAQEASASGPAADAVPVALRGAWVGQESSSQRGRDWVALIVRDDGQVDWYDDLPSKELPTSTSGRKHAKIEAISDSHLTLTYAVTARNPRLRGQTVVSTLVLDLKDDQFVGHRAFPLDEDRAITLSRAEVAH